MFTTPAWYSFCMLEGFSAINWPIQACDSYDIEMVGARSEARVGDRS